VREIGMVAGRKCHNGIRARSWIDMEPTEGAEDATEGCGTRHSARTRDFCGLFWG
jgi:hypothetical protein